MEIQVTFERLGNFANGVSQSSGKEWCKQEIVCSTIGQYPKQICFTCFNGTSDLAQRMVQGKKYKIGFDLESREWQGKWFTDAKAFAIDAIEDTPQAPQTKPQPQAKQTQMPVQDELDDLPFD